VNYTTLPISKATKQKLVALKISMQAKIGREFKNWDEFFEELLKVVEKA